MFSSNLSWKKERKLTLTDKWISFFLILRTNCVLAIEVHVLFFTEIKENTQHHGDAAPNTCPFFTKRPLFCLRRTFQRFSRNSSRNMTLNSLVNTLLSLEENSRDKSQSVYSANRGNNWKL